MYHEVEKCGYFGWEVNIDKFLLKYFAYPKEEIKRIYICWGILKPPFPLHGSKIFIELAGFRTETNVAGVL
jgi:hypothetical protein